MKPFFITTAIDYTNGAPHIGHAYEKVFADVIARCHRLKGENVFFLTGVDQHGQKVQQSAEKAGIAPQEYVDQITEKFRTLWEKLDISYEKSGGWAATTETSHKKCVQTLLQRLFDEDQIYKAKQSGYYSVRQEQFLTEKERGPDGEFGPEWGEVVLIEEENYYFKLAEHKQWLLDLLEKRPELIVPEFRLGELFNAVEKLSGDLCISRPKSRLTWGIELPFDPNYVTYVWFDALVNYISFAPGFASKSKIQNREFHSWWPPIHVIGKDILIPAHGVYWPIMLKAIGFSNEDIPTLLVHGWWNISGSKMSKSLGNVIDPLILVEKYGTEAVRYYLMADIATGKDSDFSEDRLVQRYNVDLANGFGNLLNRTLNMAHRYRGGLIKIQSNMDFDLAEFHRKIRKDFCLFWEHMKTFDTNLGIENFNSIVAAANALVDSSAPWKLAKDPEATNRLDQVLSALVTAIQYAATLLQPFAPKKTLEVFSQLKMSPLSPNHIVESIVDPQILSEDTHQLGEPSPIFPRIEVSTNS